MFRKAIVITLCLVWGLAPLAVSVDLQIIDSKKGDTAGDSFGDACEGLGDINGDGFNDFVVAEYGGSGSTGKLYLYLGGRNPFDSMPAITWDNHTAYPYLQSHYIYNVGDIDCDGVNDFMAMFGDMERIVLFKELETLDSGGMVFTLLDTNVSWLGSTIGGGGDNNNDGRPEVWIFSHDGGFNDTIWGYTGCDLLDTIPDFKIIKSHLPDNYYLGIGRELCNTCDINGDSIPDIIFGQFNGSGAGPAGRVCVVWGGEALSTEPDLVFYAPYVHPGNRDFGADLACLGDISGDSIDDIWISQGGRNYIYYGGRPFDTIPDWAMDYSFMYADIENVGDINNDGWNDVALFYSGFLINRTSFIYCYPGMDTLVDAWYSDEDYFAILREGPLCCVGIDHSWVGDVDGDGIDDILLSASSSSIAYNDYGWSIIQAGWTEPVDVDDELVGNPDEFSMRQNYPNPFNSGTLIEFALPRSGYTELKIYNLLGEVVAAPIERYLSAGEHRVQWDGKDMAGNPTATGIYFYRLKSGDYVSVRKMIMLK